MPAQKLMSTIVRLQRERRQKFGAGHLIDILRGKETPRVRQYGHDALATWGIGADLSEQQWRGVVRQLLAQGLLATHGEYGTLTVTDAASEVLSGTPQRDAPHRGRARVALARRRGPRRPRPTSSRRRPSSSSSCARGARARHASRACPRTSSSATRPCAPSPSRGPRASATSTASRGIGAKKLEAYGEALLAVVRRGVAGGDASPHGRTHACG